MIDLVLSSLFITFAKVLEKKRIIKVGISTTCKAVGIPYFIVVCPM
jgi:hypothetical protein